MILGLFSVFIVALLFGVPLFAALGLGTLFPAIAGSVSGFSSQAIVRWGIGGADQTAVIAIPMFMLAGVIMSRGGIARKIFNVFAYFIGNLTAGLPCAAILTALFYGAISGSGLATAAAVGGMTLPILVSLGYDKTFCAAMIATAGGLGVVIPPSIPMVFYGMMTNTSVGSLFTAGILPGILIGLCLMVYTWYYCKKNGEEKEKIRKMTEEVRAGGFLHLMKDSIWALLSPIIVLGGIYGGIVTPTEAAVLSVFYSLFVSIFIYKMIKIKEIPEILDNAIKQYAPMILMVALAMSFARALTVLQVPVLLGNWAVAHLNSKWIFLIAVNVLFFLLGMVMDTGPAVTILGPILAPVGLVMGVDPIQLGIIMICNLACGMVTPPFGLNLFIVSPLVEANVSDVAKKAIPYIGAFCIALILITCFPVISLFLAS